MSASLIHCLNWLVTFIASPDAKFNDDTTFVFSLRETSGWRGFPPPPPTEKRVNGEEPAVAVLTDVLSHPMMSLTEVMVSVTASSMGTVTLCRTPGSGGTDWRLSSLYRQRVLLQSRIASCCRFSEFSVKCCGRKRQPLRVQCEVLCEGALGSHI